MTKIEELSAAYEAATAGKWVEGDGLIYGEVFDESDESYLICDLSPGMAGLNEQDMHNAKYLILSHNAMPDLLRATYLLKVIRNAAMPYYFDKELIEEVDEILEKLK